MFPELSKSYEPQSIEPRWARAWFESTWFRASAAPDDARNVWSLAIPPPNVTGSLHMGHMLEHTLIDAITRWRRMSGDNTLWLPGTDHAGIATQMVVERALAAEGKDRRQMGREAFLESVWAWKHENGSRIKEQMIRIGDSCDWSRERFTLDEGLSRAVREVFVTLYEEGLIYRGRYIVNWCPRCLTAVSDLEVVHEQTTGKIYRIRYPLADDKDRYIEVATTRPETMLGDTAVAVNPSDERYRTLIGRKVEVPLTGRTVLIIADELAQPEFGTGAVKVTPAHDPNDYAAGERHQLEQIVVMDESAHMNERAGVYAGLDRFKARERIVADLGNLGVLMSVDDHALALGRCQRCRTVIEPRVSTQWFVKIAPLAKDAVEAVRREEMRFVPENCNAIFFDWMANIRDWCISRQLWWGHRIPAWYCTGCQKMLVAREEPKSCTECGGALSQDDDVLDTWFSSGLWPFSTLGWPEGTVDLAKFYPTSLMITGFDILFFWVARMVMLGVHFTGRVPFKEVYIHALVRDAERQKMSKTKGNVIDPLETTSKYGTDAVRFTLASMAAPGTDIALSEARMQGYAAFANKIWNAGRFIFTTLGRVKTAPVESRARLRARGNHPVDRWIFSRLNAVAVALDQSLSNFRFHEAADTLYHFFWHEICDWYIELVKLRLPEGASGAEAEDAASNLLAAFEGALRLLHPFMPFITEELWQTAHQGHPPQPSIALAPFPVADPEAYDVEAERQIARLQSAITQIRSLRAEWKIPAKTKLKLSLAAPSHEVAADLATHRTALQSLAGIESVSEVQSIPLDALGRASTADFDLQLDLHGHVDPETERKRLSKERDTLTKGVDNARRLLASESFRAKAPTAVLAETEAKAAELQRQLEQTEAALKALTSPGA